MWYYQKKNGGCSLVGLLSRALERQRSHMNFVFISPNFPDNFRNFCDRLSANGVNVLGVGDASYDSLSDMLKSSLTEYYKVDSMEDYGQVYRAVAFFAFKYGRIDWIESNNEYWLELDARLRQDFNVMTGVQPEDLALWKSKAAMKPVYRAAGIPSARQHRVSTIEAALEFLDEIGGYPVFAKPNVGVGASATFKIDNEEELKAFFDEVSGKDYVMEEYISGDIYTYDAICDENGKPVFESSFTCVNVADSVNDDTEAIIYVVPEVPDQLREYGRRALKGFKVRSRFVHFEFFKLTEARKGLAEAGEYVGLEVNMRPAGGFIPDMMNYAHSTDVYRIWADMVCGKSDANANSGPDRYCIFVGAKDRFKHVHSHDEILARYDGKITMCQRMPAVFYAAMGSQMYMALLDTEKEVGEFAYYVLDEEAPKLMPHLFK